MIRVLIVDDSPTARMVLKKMVDASPGMTVVGTANHGEEALERIPQLQPQVVCTDLHMPTMDGLQLTREIMARHPLPILVVSISVHQDSNDQNIFELLEAGAIDVFPKPRGGLESAGEALTQELASKIKVLSVVVPIRRHTTPRKLACAKRLPPSAIRHTAISAPVNDGLVAIGASTGGPQALLTIFSSLPANFPLPILCVQHISHGFLEEMVHWLNGHTPLKVQIAKEDEKPLPGHIYFPQEETHLSLTSHGRFIMEPGTSQDTHRPAVDVTFRALAQVYGKRGIAVLLTGMGRDGADGMLAVSQAGGLTLAQDETSCVVFGMPKQAIDLGAVKQIVPPDEIASILCQKTHTILPSPTRRRTS